MDQDHQAKRHKVLICDIQQKSSKKRPQICPTEIPRKDPENHPKGKIGGTTQPSLEKPRQIIYTYQRGSYKV
jgi:hypothetical protein